MILFHAEATAELLEAQDWYNERYSGRGDKFIREVRQACGLIDRQPTLFARVSGERRMAVVSRFPYGVVYEVHPPNVVILAIAHLRRRPEYWADRSAADVP